jgi:hypothetical protein
MPDNPRIEAQVAQLLDDNGEPLVDEDGEPWTSGTNISRFVINTGSKNKVNLGDKYVIYSLGSEVKDPTSGASLGRLEMVRGRAVVIHVQESISILRTTDTKIVRRSYVLPGIPDTETVDVPFRVLEVGDFARPI